MSLLSCGIPVWRPPRAFLEAAIESVLSQDFPEPIPVTCICARNDPTVGWLPKAYPEVDIRWVRRSHIGRQHDEAVRGDLESVWTAFLDADDAWVPGAAAAVLDAQKDEVALFGDLILCHADLSREKIRRVPSKITVANAWNHGRGNLFSDHAIFRRSAMRKVGWYRIDRWPYKYFCWDAWIRLACQYGPKCFRKVSSYYCYRQWKGQWHVADERQQPLKREVAQERSRFLAYWKRRIG